MKEKEEKTTLLIDGCVPIFHVKMDKRKFGLSEVGAMLQDMAEEYAVIANEKANAGLVVYGKYNGVWRVNPWSTRFLIRILLENSGVSLPVTSSAHGDSGNLRQYVVSGVLPTDEQIINEAEGRYPVKTHSSPDNSPYVGIQKTFMHGVRWALAFVQGNHH